MYNRTIVRDIYRSQYHLQTKMQKLEAIARITTSVIFVVVATYCTVLGVTMLCNEYDQKAGILTCTVRRPPLVSEAPVS